MYIVTSFGDQSVAVLDTDHPQMVRYRLLITTDDFLNDYIEVRLTISGINTPIAEGAWPGINYQDAEAVDVWDRLVLDQMRAAGVKHTKGNIKEVEAISKLAKKLLLRRAGADV